MPLEVDAYDGGQKHRLRLGESQTVVWRAVNMPDSDSLASSSSQVTGTAVTAVQSYLTTPDVGYKITASELGSADVEITLTTTLGEIHKHRLIFEVFT